DSRTIPMPISPSTSLSPSAPRNGNAIVHSPRPQLTPKTSFSIENGGRPKSQRVEDLERMATVIGLQKQDLSGDIPKDDVLAAVSTALKNFEKEFVDVKREEVVEGAVGSGVGVEVSKGKERAKEEVKEEAKQ